MRTPACSIFIASLASLWFAAHSAHAQQAVETIDPALLNSEPIEEMPPEQPKPTPTKLPLKKEIPALLPEKITEIEEVIKSDYPIAHLQGLNKVTAKTTAIEAPINVTVNFGTLQITLKKCWKAAPDSTPENAALLEIVDNKSGGSTKSSFSSSDDVTPATRRGNAALGSASDTDLKENRYNTAFSGWMFSSSPAISALEHPVYDITVLECADKK